jgi:hypothetical protein
MRNVAEVQDGHVVEDERQKRASTENAAGKDVF